MTTSPLPEASLKAMGPVHAPMQAPVCIVGAGALGSFVGARLALAGQAVQMVGRPAQVQALAAGGLRLIDASGTRTVALPATTEMAAVAQAGLVVLCVKSADTEAAARQLAPHLAPDAVVLSLQNGVANAPLLAALLRRPVLAGVAYIAAAMPAPGEVRHAGGLGVVMGVVLGAVPGVAAGADAQATALQVAPNAQAVKAVQERLQQAGFEVSLSATPLAELWRKLVVNCACNAISALAQAPYGVMAALPAVRELQAAVVREAVAVARAEGQALDEAEMLAAVDRVARLMATQRSSTAQDLARGRTSEIDHLNGEVLRAGARHGIHTPANQALVALVKLQEAMQAQASQGQDTQRQDISRP